MTDRLLELAALDAAGALSSAGQQELRAVLASASPATVAAVAEFYDVAAMLPAGSALDQPSAAVRARILAHAHS